MFAVCSHLEHDMLTYVSGMLSELRNQFCKDVSATTVTYVGLRERVRKENMTDDVMLSGITHAARVGCDGGGSEVRTAQAS